MASCGCIAWAVAFITHESFHGELARSMALVLPPRGRTMTNAILQDMQKDTTVSKSSHTLDPRLRSRCHHYSQHQPQSLPEVASWYPDGLTQESAAWFSSDLRSSGGTAG